MKLIDELREAEDGSLELEGKIIRELGHTFVYGNDDWAGFRRGKDPHGAGLELVMSWTRSIDDALKFVELALPDTDERKYSCTIWTGSGLMTGPAARIVYKYPDDGVEGGWGLKVVTGVISAKTTPLAICAAALIAKEVL